jgi:DNA repair protein RadC
LQYPCGFFSHCYLFFGGSKSVIVPSAISTAKAVSSIKGINVQTLAKTIITKFNKDFLNITIDDLLTVKGIGQAKALQVYSAVALIKRFYQEQNNTDLIINNVQNVLTLAFNIRDKKKEH